MLLQTKIFNLMSDIQALIRKIHSVSKMCHEISILKISINEAGKFLQSQHNLVRSCYEKVYPLWDALANFSQDSSQKNENNNSTNSQNALNSEYIQEATLKICQDIPTSDPTIQTAQSSTNTSMKRRPTARKGTRTLKTNSVFHYTIRHVARNKIKEGPDFLQYNVVKDQYNNGSITEETSLDDANNCSTVDSDLEVISKEYQIASPISALDIDVCANTHSTENDCSYEEGNHIPQTSNVEDEIQHAGSMLHSVNENTQCIIDYQRESVREYLNFNGESSCHTGTTIAAKKLANAHKKLKCICHNSEGETFCANQIAHRNTKSLFTLSVEYGYNHSTDNCLSRPNDQKDKSTGNNQKANWEQCMLMCNIPSNDDITDSMWIYKNKSELPSK
ncbi:uncharacterized protein [Periplaneta americana]|uniref:uncharacterized protein n=1 Tax=Periplaneta americana TaxID=6978 RepID=UPI0037E8CEC1